MTEACLTPRFFIAQALIISLEYVFISTVRRCFGAKTRWESVNEGVVKDVYVLPSWLSRAGQMVGYVWVFSWFCWLIPPLCGEVLKWGIE